MTAKHHDAKEYSIVEFETMMQKEQVSISYLIITSICLKNWRVKFSSIRRDFNELKTRCIYSYVFLCNCICTCSRAHAYIYAQTKVFIYLSALMKADLNKVTAFVSLYCNCERVMFTWRTLIKNAHACGRFSA